MSLTPPKPQGPDGRYRVVLDCDTANEIDDQFAIAHALGAPNIDVVGVISVHNTLAHGPGSVKRYQREARTVVELCGYENVPCPSGAATPMEDMHTPVESEGLEFLRQTARDGPFTLLATGPATDVASFVLAEPKLAAQVEIIWAGAFPDPETWERHKFGELNARADIQSWRALFSADVPLRVLPGWPGVETVVVSQPAASRQLRALDHPAADYLAELLDGWIEARSDGQLDMDSSDRPPEQKVIWDIVNVAALSAPNSVRWAEHPLPYIDPAGVPDWDRTGANVPWGLEVDADAVLGDLWSALARLPRATPAT